MIRIILELILKTIESVIVSPLYNTPSTIDHTADGTQRHTTKNTQRKIDKYSVHFGFCLDKSKSMPDIAVKQMKTGFKLQAKFISI